MLTINSMFDEYALRARLLPTLLLLLPVAAIIAVVLPEIYATYIRILGSFGLTAVTIFLLAHVIRAKGRALEQRLYVEWGGVPTTVWLRHRDHRLDPNTKKRYHKFLESRVPGLRMPTAEEEKRDRKQADLAYASGVKRLLELTRDTKKYRLVFAENISYGFRRNTLAAKPLAIAVLVFEIFAVLTVAYARHRTNLAEVGVDIWSALIIAVSACIFWVTFVTKSWVQDAANAYARALLASCEGV